MWPRALLHVRARTSPSPAPSPRSPLRAPRGSHDGADATPARPDPPPEPRASRVITPSQRGAFYSRVATALLGPDITHSPDSGLWPQLLGGLTWTPRPPGSAVSLGASAAPRLSPCTWLTLPCDTWEGGSWAPHGLITSRLRLWEGPPATVRTAVARLCLSHRGRGTHPVNTVRGV